MGDIIRQIVKEMLHRRDGDLGQDNDLGRISRRGITIDTAQVADGSGKNGHGRFAHGWNGLGCNGRRDQHIVPHEHTQKARYGFINRVRRGDFRKGGFTIKTVQKVFNAGDAQIAEAVGIRSQESIALILEIGTSAVLDSISI